MISKESTRVIFYTKNDDVVSILEQLPKGVKSMFIEQAILEFSSRKPKIEFFFNGITKQKRKRRTKEEMEKDNQSVNAQNLKEKNIKDSKIEKKGGGMMFDFGQKE